MKKSILSLMVACSLVISSTSSALASTQNPETNNVTSNVQSELNKLNKDVQDAKTERINKLEKFKKSKYIKVVSDDGNGCFTIAASDNVKTKDDFKKLLSEVNGGTTLGSNTLTDTEEVHGNNGTLTQSVYAKESDTDPWVGNETITISNGLSSTSWVSNGDDTSQYDWDSLKSMKDTITFGYDSVSSTGGISFTASDKPGASVSAGWTKGTSSSSYNIKWSDYNSANSYYSKYFGGYGLTTSNVTSASISSSAIANFSFGGQISGAAYDYVSVS
ncbi:hypothetical protein [uncultured Clostridium sp.]|uniref:hypothetical protein n=1 Tax=uncultured Clostridium sp. TaxID=59620 RepID=UPI0028E79DA5|nr:hypothetical protein [uncultured Clostridium sp.]